MKWILLLLFPISLFASLNGPGDFQIWNTDTVNIHVTRRTILQGQTEFRYGRDSSRLYYKHYQGLLVFIRSPNVLVAPGYRQTFWRTSKKWLEEYNPMLDIILQAKTKSNWFFSNRARTVYRIFEEGHDRWLFRNRLEVLTPWRISRYGMGPFFSEEFFWEESRGINQNRVIFGFRIPYHERTQLDLYYMYRVFKNAHKDWVNQNILGIHFSLHF